MCTRNLHGIPLCECIHILLETSYVSTHDEVYAEVASSTSMSPSSMQMACHNMSMTLSYDYQWAMPFTTLQPSSFLIFLSVLAPAGLSSSKKKRVIMRNLLIQARFGSELRQLDTAAFVNDSQIEVESFTRSRGMYYSSKLPGRGIGTA